MTRKLLSLVMALMLALGLAGALAEGFEGFYDYDAPYGLDTDINLILTPDGHGRLINSSGSVSFDFTEEDGRLVPDSDQLALELDGDRATATVAGRVHRVISTFSVDLMSRGSSRSFQGV